MTENKKSLSPENENATPSEQNFSVHSDDVAVPEIRTGKVDVEGEFHKKQHTHNLEHEHHVSFDTVAVPEYHTGKCPPWDPDCDKHEEAHEHKHHNIFSDLARTLINGRSDE